MMTSVEEMIGQYVNAWNGNSEAEFQREFSKCWSAEATYTDPDFENITGVEGICGLAKASLEALSASPYFQSFANRRRKVCTFSASLSRTGASHRAKAHCIVSRDYAGISERHQE